MSIVNIASSEPVESGQRIGSLEAYRGLAALGVVIFHTYQHSRIGEIYVFQNTPFHLLLRNLDSGVSIFFSLSGFLIFLPFARAAIEQKTPQSARGFLIRRAIRIVPLYYVAILIVWSLRYSGGLEQWQDLFRHLTFTQIFDSAHIFWTIGPAWSLAVEVWFYMGIALAAPLLQYACSQLPQPRGRALLLGGVIVSLSGLSLFYKAWVFYGAHLPETNYAVYYGLLAKVDVFAFGMFLAVLAVMIGKSSRLKGLAPVALRLLAFGLIVITFILREGNAGIDLFFYTIIGLASVLFLAATVLGDRAGLWERILSNPILTFLGVISYSVYIWHEPLLIEMGKSSLFPFDSPVFFLISTTVLLLITVGVGALSYYAIEYPTMYIRHLFTREGQLTSPHSK